MKFLQIMIELKIGKKNLTEEESPLVLVVEDNE